jgi:hypothetical protein
MKSFNAMAVTEMGSFGHKSFLWKPHSGHTIVRANSIHVRTCNRTSGGPAPVDIRFSIIGSGCVLFACEPWVADVRRGCAMEFASRHGFSTQERSGAADDRRKWLIPGWKRCWQTG